MKFRVKNRLNILKLKKIIFILILISSFQKNLSAQNPLNVIITGECSILSGSYTYNGVVNGKNNYTKTFVFDDVNVVFEIVFDTEEWILYSDSTLFIGFYNSDNPAGLLPPFTGWENLECQDGTMIIQQNLSPIDFDYLSSEILIYPNPASNFITIKNENNAFLAFNYKIFDLTGRNILSGASKFNEQIDIESVTTGNYVMQVETESGLKSTLKLIKK